ncbi:DUF2158 domain-containing protein [Roseobacter sp. TSBP12]|uniref:YodC family protein n=1 Tax=Roseobacter sp. TSBP12 TaxID=1236613 RepID=UPI001869DBA6|nr:DUF2158 domain-containing protein [Roseobacter sp. TSBP12]
MKFYTNPFRLKPPYQGVEPMTCADAAAAAPFKEGDTVLLKSGGPLMTVVYPASCGGEVQCYWFNASTLETESFPAACLMDGRNCPNPF